ncbi:2-nitropropane dioxygenase [Pectinatus haikarae]|uniref:Phage protein n=1 Tax=Pectinatus haikarae TaxID=349096 RepID=A0ABT9Y5R6_9FIRM|nr:2-nitropropane dioxygenase [Pectinatus haikarae]MDQ0202484.1 hypothetical protein [Pectinatus haikarae]
MSIKLIAKKKLAFHNPNNREEAYSPEILAFENAPDWIADDPLFGWAKTDGSIEVSEDISVTADKAAQEAADKAASDTGKKK